MIRIRKRWNLRFAATIFLVWVIATLWLASATVVFTGFGGPLRESDLMGLTFTQWFFYSLWKWSWVTAYMIVPGGILAGAILALLSRLHRPRINGNGAALALLSIAGVAMQLNWLIEAAIVVVAMVATTVVLGAILWLGLQQRRYHSVREE